MAEPALQSSADITSKKPPSPAADTPRQIRLAITVTDEESISELFRHPEGSERDSYAATALRIGLMSLRQARGQLDVETVRQEGHRLLAQIGFALNEHRNQVNEGLASSLKEYFDPESGRFNERVHRLIKKDGELEQVLRRQIGGDGSELANTLAATVGESSPLMKVLDPKEAAGVVHAIGDAVERAVMEDRENLLSEFSLDNKEGALHRFISEISTENGQLKVDLGKKIDGVVEEFSLDKPESALSRLVGRVEHAQKTIAAEFSLDNNESALSRMSRMLMQTNDAVKTQLTLDTDQSALSLLKRELLNVLSEHETKNRIFQQEVTGMVAGLAAQRKEARRSTTHGNDFEETLCQVLEREAQSAGDVATRTGTTPGSIRNCKIGDMVVELGPDHVARGARVAIECKEDSSYKLGDARAEIEQARKNREAGVGIFVFSKRTAPENFQPLRRLGNDIFVVWDSEDEVSDVYLSAAMTLARALCVQDAGAAREHSISFSVMDDAILEIERQAEKLDKIKTWTETIRNNSGNVLDEVRKMKESLVIQIRHLRDALSSAKIAVRPAAAGSRIGLYEGN